MSMLVSMSREDQLRILEEFLASDDVKNRPDPFQRRFDRIVAKAIEANELELATAVWALIAFRAAGLQGDAAGLLLSRLAQLSAAGTLREILDGLIANPAAGPGPVRKCRDCGCTDARACLGGCRWVEADLCSACATYPFPCCLICDQPAPADVETAFRDGWVDGCCSGCDAVRGTVVKLRSYFGLNGGTTQ